MTEQTTCQIHVFVPEGSDVEEWSQRIESCTGCETQIYSGARVSSVIVDTEDLLLTAAMLRAEGFDL